MREIRMTDLISKSTDHFFGPSAMHSFKTRLPDLGLELADGSCLFVSSEKRDGERYYSVRKMTPKGSTFTARDADGGSLAGFGTRAKANAAMQRLAEHLEGEVSDGE